ncbi:hypothetical protein SISNIDRAFT_419995, partial [Sistotremastrum niveocremeum HHB9708]
DDIGIRDFATIHQGGDYIQDLTSFTQTSPAPSKSKECSERSCIVLQGRKSPLVALTPWTDPTDCWAFQGSYGHLGITLSSNIIVTHVTIDHVVPILALNTRSAPRNLKLWTILRDPFHQERYTRSSPCSENIQTFEVPKELVQLGIGVSSVVLEINSNWGNPRSTCLYRVRVHSEHTGL